MVELALVLPILLGLFGVVLQGGLLFSDQIGLAHFGAEGAAWAEQNPQTATAGDSGTVAQHISQQLCGSGDLNFAVNTSAPTKYCQQGTLTVHVSVRNTPTSMVRTKPTGDVLGASNCKAWDLSVTPPSITVGQSSQVQYSVSLLDQGGGGQDPQVALSATQTPSGVIPGVPYFNPGQIGFGQTAILQFTTSSSTVPGNYTIHLTGIDQCNSKSASGNDTLVALQVTGPSPVPSPTPSSPAPTVISSSVASMTQAAGGTTTLTGTNFRSGATAAIGATAATSVSVVSSTRVDITVPAGITPGTYNVTVTNTDGQAGTLSNGLTITSGASPAPSASPAPLAANACAPMAGSYEYTITIGWTDPMFVPWITAAFPLTATQFAGCQ
jgi:Flp pilus assembly protein TadG